MNADQRHKFILWFCMLSPTGFAAVVAATTDGFSKELDYLVPTPFKSFVFVYSPMIGWIVLTLACSVTLAMDVFRTRVPMRPGCGRRIIYANSFLLLTFLIMLIHFCCTVMIMGIASRIFPHPV